MRRIVLFGDIERLQRAYPEADGFRRALAGVWLPDALAGAHSRSWRSAFGFDLGDVRRYVAAGFHPAELAVLHGRRRAHLGGPFSVAR